MLESESTKELLTALMAAQANIAPIAKTQDGYKFKYADHADVQTATRDHLAAVGLVFTHQPDGDTLLTKLRHVASGEWIACRTPLTIDGGPQEFGSSMTYAKRYAEVGLGNYVIVGEDDDGTRAQEHAAKRASKPKTSAPAKPQTDDQTKALLDTLTIESERLLNTAAENEISGAPEDQESMENWLKAAAKSYLGLKGNAKAADIEPLITTLKYSVLNDDGTIGFEPVGERPAA